MNNDNTIKTIQPNGKVGQPMERNSYEAIKLYMLKILDHGNSIDINTFINLAHEKFEPIHKVGTGMMVYSVKRDLEARGLICHEYKTRKVSSTRLALSLAGKSTVESVSMNYTTPKINEIVQNKFIELFAKAPIIAQAPGRINLIGDHTDYNEGFVLPAAINKGIQVAIGPSSNNNSLIFSNRFNQFLSIDTRKPLNRIRNSKWQNYLIGILAKLQLDGYKVKPLNCVFDGDLPIGSGLASSASLACAFIVGLNELYHLNLTVQKMIEIAHWSENNFARVKCGIMDHFISMLGKEGSLLYLDCQTQVYEYHPINLDGHCFLLCDSNIKHSHQTSIYNKRNEECTTALEKIKTLYPAIKSIRDVSEEILRACKPSLTTKLYNRLRFVTEENERVKLAKSCLVSGYFKNLGEAMFQSHHGLSKLFDVSCSELDFLVTLGKKHKGILGSRMMGGGFGGCTLNLIRNDNVGPFIQYAQAAYKQKFNMGLHCYIVQLCDGASVLANPSSNRIKNLAA